MSPRGNAAPGPLVGAHLSVAGGLFRAIDRAVSIRATALQIFLKNQVQWTGKPLAAGDAARFRERLAASDVRRVVAHACYLINLAAPEGEIARRSVAALADEVRRAARLGVEAVIFHPGSHVGTGEAPGLARVARRLDRVLRETAGLPVRLLVETTAGAGATVGHRFEHLARILDGASDPERVGVCVDTCHVFAAGYDLSTEDGWEKTFQELDLRVGLARVRAFHVNDSRGAAGSHLDRHEHLGKGRIGRTAFRLLMRDARFRDVPKILETPKADGEPRSRGRRHGAAFADIDPADRRNLAFLRPDSGSRTAPETTRPSDVPSEGPFDAPMTRL